MTVTGAIRFVIGAGLVAAGGTLVAPLATKLAAAARMTAADPAAVGPTAAPSPAVRVDAPLVPAAAPAAAAPPPGPWGMTPGDAWDVACGAMSADSGGGLQLDRGPPPPPAPLPPPPQSLAEASPALAGAYRSTLHVPPPALLDSAGQPVAPWAGLPAPGAAPGTAIAASPGVAAHEVTVPSTYRIRDGDDLGTIAGRFYGDTSVASAIWAANRATIPQPDLLPIGAEVHLPPPWAVDGHRRPAAGTIEPVAYGRPVGHATSGGAAAPVPTTAPWLAPAADQPAPAAVHQWPAAPQPAGGASSVRIGPGETLASLARRLYGDPALAEQIFALNRDRLRSPDLVVAGMDLRLPRPVTAPGP